MHKNCLYTRKWWFFLRSNILLVSSVYCGYKIRFLNWCEIKGDKWFDWINVFIKDLKKYNLQNRLNPLFILHTSWFILFSLFMNSLIILIIIWLHLTLQRVHTLLFLHHSVFKLNNQWVQNYLEQRSAYNTFVDQNMFLLHFRSQNYQRQTTLSCLYVQNDCSVLQLFSECSQRLSVMCDSSVSMVCVILQGCPSSQRT